MTKTAKLAALCSDGRISTEQLLAELRNRFDNGTGGGIDGFLDSMLEAYPVPAPPYSGTRTAKLQYVLENDGVTVEDIAAAAATRNTGSIERFIDQLHSNA
jgi:hypothetical protein